MGHWRGGCPDRPSTGWVAGPAMKAVESEGWCFVKWVGWVSPCSKVPILISEKMLGKGQKPQPPSQSNNGKKRGAEEAFRPQLEDWAEPRANVPPLRSRNTEGAKSIGRERNIYHLLRFKTIYQKGWMHRDITTQNIVSLLETESWNTQKGLQAFNCQNHIILPWMSVLVRKSSVRHDLTRKDHPERYQRWKSRMMRCPNSSNKLQTVVYDLVTSNLSRPHPHWNKKEHHPVHRKPYGHLPKLLRSLVLNVLTACNSRTTLPILSRRINVPWAIPTRTFSPVKFSSSPCSPLHVQRGKFCVVQPIKSVEWIADYDCTAWNQPSLRR